MSLGLDTSIVLRLLTGRPEKQAAIARKRLERALIEGEEILVSDLVLGEAYFALHHHYHVPDAAVRRQILAMLRANVLTTVPPGAVRAFEASGGAGMMDRLIHERYRSMDAVTATFDRRLGALEGAVRLDSRR